MNTLKFIFASLLLLKSTSMGLCQTDRYPQLKIVPPRAGAGAEVSAAALKAVELRHGLQFTWKDQKGQNRSWNMGKEYFENKVRCPEGDFDRCADLSDLPDLSVRCYAKCIMSNPDVHTYDSQKKRVYFSVELDFASNVPRAVFEVDLSSQSVHHLFTEFGSGVGGFKSSPSDRYITFSSSQHGSVCAVSAESRVYDRESNQVINLALNPEPGISDGGISGDTRVVAYGIVEWISEKKIKMKRSSWQCRHNEVIQ